MKKLVKKNSKGWFWPKSDGGGDMEGETSCWHYMQTHPNTPELISEHVPEKGVVVQAGGNCGFYVKQYAGIFNTVYTFEPDPINFYCLNLNVTETNVIKLQAVLGEIHKGFALRNLLPDVGATHVFGEGTIPCFTIDDLALTRCDLIHLDIEGFELYALIGGKNTITQFKPVIALEFHDAWADRYKVKLDDIKDYLGKLGYEYQTEALGDMIFKFKG
jgi:FkbM family methyltransferase